MNHESRPTCPHSVDAAPFALGALDDPQSFQAHLETCEICTAEVAEFQRAVNLLPRTAPVVATPPELMSRVMATVRSEAELLQAAGESADRVPPKKRSLAERVPRVFGLPRSASWAMGAALAACIAVLAVVAINPGADETVIKGEVAANVGTADASATLVDSGDSAHLKVTGMPEPGDGKIYEVWIQHTDGTVSATDSLFGVTSDGSGSVHVADDLTDVKAVMVTVEPEGGSDKPTSQPMITINVPS
jgi:anti-sigma-K factor RskA